MTNNYYWRSVRDIESVNKLYKWQHAIVCSVNTYALFRLRNIPIREENWFASSLRVRSTQNVHLHSLPLPKNNYWIKRFHFYVDGSLYSSVVQSTIGVWIWYITFTRSTCPAPVSCTVIADCWCSHCHQHLRAIRTIRIILCWYVPEVLHCRYSGHQQNNSHFGQ